MAIKNILIIGAGISGLSLAINLKKMNIPFRLIENQSKWNKKGLAMTIKGEGLKSASSLGILKEIKIRGTKRNLTKIYNNNEIVLKQLVPNSSDSSFVVQRDTLHEALRAKLSNIEMNLSVSNIKKQKIGFDVTFNNGSTDSFDLIIGADGINSTTRKYLYNNKNERSNFSDSTVQYSGSVLWGITLDKKFNEIIEIWDKNRMCAFYPIQDKTVISFFKKAPVSFSSPREERAGHIKKYFSTISNPLIQEILNYLPDDIFFDQVRYTRPEKWNTGHITVIGDACHSLSPLSGLGANLAMTDAVGLAQIILKYKETDNFPDILKKYNFQRKLEADKAYYLSKFRSKRGMLGFPGSILRDIKMKQSSWIY